MKTRSKEIFSIQLFLTLSLLFYPLFSQDEEAPAKHYTDGETIYLLPTTPIKLSSSDKSSHIAKIEYAMDQEEFKEYDQSITIDKEGMHNIKFRSVDIVGNVESENTISITIDNSPPQVDFRSSVPFIQHDGKQYVSAKDSPQISFIAKDLYSGVKKVMYALAADSDMMDYSSAIALSGAGPFLVRFMAEDQLGLKSEEKTVEIHMDSEAPNVIHSFETPIAEKDGTKYSIRNNVLKLSAMDEGVGVEKIFIKTDLDEVFQTYSSEISLTNPGERKIMFKAIDKLGNESEVTTLEFIVDGEPPKTILSF